MSSYFVLITWVLCVLEIMPDRVRGQHARTNTSRSAFFIERHTTFLPSGLEMVNILNRQ